MASLLLIVDHIEPVSRWHGQPVRRWWFREGTSVVRSVGDDGFNGGRHSWVGCGGCGSSRISSASCVRVTSRPFAPVARLVVRHSGALWPRTPRELVRVNRETRPAAALGSRGDFSLELGLRRATPSAPTRQPPKQTTDGSRAPHAVSALPAFAILLARGQTGHSFPTHPFPKCI